MILILTITAGMVSCNRHIGESGSMNSKSSSSINSSGSVTSTSSGSQSKDNSSFVSSKASPSKLGSSPISSKPASSKASSPSVSSKASSSFSLPHNYNPGKPLSDQQGNWLMKPAYSDEFDGTALDTSKWNNNIPDWGEWSWEPKNTSVSNGNLNVTMNYEPNSRGFFTSGAVQTRATPILYGYFEARFKAPSRFPGVCPAFWLYNNAGSTTWTEIDIVELYSSAWELDRVCCAVHIFEHPRASADSKTLPIHDSRSIYKDYPQLDFRDDYHVYGCEWNETEVKFYFNGEHIGTRKNDYLDQPLNVIFSMGVRPPQRYSSNPESTGYPTTTQVDYIRVWQRG